jgi:hypothetical protein
MRREATGNIFVRRCFYGAVGRVTDCRHLAAECLALAKQARDPACELLFLEMSAFWKDLATTIARYLDEDTAEEGTFESADRPRNKAS